MKAKPVLLLTTTLLLLAAGTLGFQSGGLAISGLPAVTTVHANDLLVEVDVTTTGASSGATGPNGTDRKMTVSQLFGAPSNGNLLGWEGVPTPIIVGSGLTLTGTGPYTLAVSSGGGTVNSGTSGQVAYYSSTGTAVSGTSLSSLIDTSLGNTQGQVLYRGASGWAALAPGTTGQVLTTNGAAANPSWTAVTGTGTVTSVGLSLPGIFTVTGSPVTTSGTLSATLGTQSANVVWAGPSSGSAAAPTFRALVAADMPSGTGTVTSVGLSAPSWLSVGGSPVTTSGTLALSAATGQTANQFLATPSGSSGAVGLRAMTTTDLPTGIPNANLQNSSLTVATGAGLSGGGSVSLGGSITHALAIWNPQSVKTSAYAANPNDLVPVDISSGNVTITLPTAPTDKTLICVKVVAVATGNANTCTVATGGSDVFNKSGGATSLSLVQPFQTVSLQYYASGAIWYVFGADNSVPSTQLNITQHYGTITTDSDAATITFNLATSDWHQVQLGGSRTLALSNPVVGQQFTLIIQQPASGGPDTVTWFSTILWPGGTAPTLSTGASKRDIFTFKCISSGNYLGFVAGQNL